MLAVAAPLPTLPAASVTVTEIVLMPVTSCTSARQLWKPSIVVASIPFTRTSATPCASLALPRTAMESAPV
jgi:hypothetical protein